MKPKNALRTFVLVIILAAVGARFFSTRFLDGEPQMDVGIQTIFALRDNKGQFQFFVYQLSNGKRRYTAKLLNMPFPARNSEETAEMTENEWLKIASFKPQNRQIDQWSEWGTLERHNSTVKISTNDFVVLEGSVIGSSRSRLGMKAKNF